MATLHDRMPVILEPGDYDRWLDPGVTDVDEIRDLLRPYPGEMQAYPVGGAVNNARNDGPGLIEPGRAVRPLLAPERPPKRRQPGARRRARYGQRPR